MLLVLRDHARGADKDQGMHTFSVILKNLDFTLKKVEKSKKRRRRKGRMRKRRSQ